MSVRPLDVIERAADPRSALKASFELIPGGLGEAAAASAEGGVILGGEAAGGVGAALFGFILLIVLAVILVVCIGIVLFYRQLRGITDHLSVFGHNPAQDALDAAYGVLSPILHSFEDQCFKEWENAKKSLQNMCIWALQGGPFASHSQTHAAIAHATQPLISSVGALDTWTRNTAALNEQAIRHLAGQAHALWSRLTNIEAQQSADEGVLTNHAHAIYALQADQIALAHEMVALKNEIVKDERIIQAQGRQISHLIHTVSVLQSGMAHLTGRVLADERAMAPAIEVAVVGAVLGPLIAAGPAAIEELARLGRNPCRCFQIPGSEGWVQKAMVAKLWWDSEP